MLETIVAVRDVLVAVLLGLAGVDYTDGPRSEARAAEREVFRIAFGPEGDAVTIAVRTDEREDRTGRLDAPVWTQPHLPRLRLIH